MISVRSVRDHTGERFGRLVVLDRVITTGRSGHHARWRCQCDCGTETVVPSYRLRSGATQSCGCGVVRQGSVKTSTPTYKGAHTRVTTAKGSASEYDCVDCGQTAIDWSYDGEDVNELTGPDGRGYQRRYSLDVSHYVARCRPCHKAYDTRGE